MKSFKPAAFILIALTGAAGACSKKGPPAADIQTVQAATVDEIESNVAERYSATILPNMQVDLAFKSPGIIEQLYQVRGADGRLRDVDTGDHVTAGTQLASVRRVDYQQKIEQGKAGVGQAQAQLAQAKAAFADAELDYNRAKNLYGSGSLTKPDFDRAHAQYESTRAQVEAARSAIEGAQSQVSQAETSLEDTVLRAPITGYIIARKVSKGSLVGNSTLGFSIIDTHVVKAEFAIPDTSLKAIRLGQRLTVGLDALQRPVSGTITAISPQADPKSRVFSVDITIPNASGAIRPGMIGNLSLGGASRPEKHLAIPLSAVVRAPENPRGFAVFRIEGRDGKNYAVARPVQIGNTYGNAIEVTSGVARGERIVALGGELLRNGQEIRVLE
jgi:multidrug efflux system membrane fusion protein